MQYYQIPLILTALLHLYLIYVAYRAASELSAPLNQFKPYSKILYWPFQGGTLLWIFYVFLSCVCYAFVHVCLYVPCGHLLGKG